MLSILLISSLFCLGVCNATKQGGILSLIRTVAYFYPISILRKPLYDCLPCMASIWGGSALIIQLYFPYPIALVLVYIGAISGINTLLTIILDKLGYEWV
jgi:hypothetical protein